MVIDRKSVITDTKAILKYFGEKYTEDDLLYPTNKQDEIDTSVSFAIDELHDLVVKVYVCTSDYKLEQNCSKFDLNLYFLVQRCTR